jgi:hypothetical protein
MCVTASSCSTDCCMLLRAYCTAAVTAAFTAARSHADTKAATSTLQRNAVAGPSNTDTVRVLLVTIFMILSNQSVHNAGTMARVHKQR